MAEEQKPLEDHEITTNWDELSPTFDSMELKEDLLRGIYAYGFERPSAIQQRAIKPTLMGKDVIAQAQSGKCQLHSQDATLFPLCRGAANKFRLTAVIYAE